MRRVTRPLRLGASDCALTRFAAFTIASWRVSRLRSCCPRLDSGCAVCRSFLLLGSGFRFRFRSPFLDNYFFGWLVSTGSSSAAGRRLTEICFAVRYLKNIFILLAESRPMPVRCENTRRSPRRSFRCLSALPTGPDGRAALLQERTHVFQADYALQ